MAFNGQKIVSGLFGHPVYIPYDRPDELSLTDTEGQSPSFFPDENTTEHAHYDAARSIKPFQASDQPSHCLAFMVSIGSDTDVEILDGSLVPDQYDA